MYLGQHFKSTDDFTSFLKSWQFRILLHQVIHEPSGQQCKVEIIWGLKFIHSLVFSLEGRALAGTRAQSCDRYGCGTLHPRRVLGGSLPLLSPVFRRSHFSRQVPPSATTREFLAAKCGSVGEKDVR